MPDTSCFPSGIDFKALGINLFSLDCEYRYTGFSDLHQKVIKTIWGVEIKTGMNILDCIKSPLDRAKAKDNFDRALRGESFVLEEEYDDESSGRAYYENNYQPVFDSKGRVTGLTVFCYDLTKLYQAKKELHKSFEKAYWAAAIVDSSNDGIIGKDINGIITSWNKGAENILGYTSVEMVGASILRIVPPDKHEEEADILAKVKQGQKLIHFETQRLCKNQKRIDVSLTLSPIKNQSGQVVGISKTLRDITEHKQMEMELRKERERLSAIIKGANIGTWEWNIQTGEMVLNERWAEMIGYTLEEISPTTIETRLKFTHPDDLQPRLQHLERHFRGETVYNEFESRARHKDGRWVVILDRGKVITWTKDGKPLLMYGTRQDITQRKQIEEALRKSEELYRSLFENMLNGFAYCRMLFEDGKPTDFIYLAVNAAFEKQTGLKNVIGKKVTEVIPGIRQTDPVLLETYGRVVSTGQPEYFELFVQSLQMWFGISVYRPETGCFVAIFDVITQRKHAEIELQTSERDFRTLAEVVPQIVWCTRPDGWTIYLNQRWVDYTGMTLEESYGFDGWNIPFHPDDRQRAWDAWKKAVQSGGDYSLECRLRRADGVYRWWLIRGAPLRDENGTILKWFGTCTDIDDIKQAEERQRLQISALEASANAIVITDNKGVIEWVNSAFCSLTGYAQAEAIGNTPAVLKSGKHPQSFYKKLWDTILSGNVWHGELVNKRKDGTLYTEEMNITPLKNGRGELTHFIAIKQDITHRKLVEEKLLQKHRLESIGTLASGLAHDLNNILAPITLATGVLQSVTDAETRNSLVTTIADCARRGSDIIKQVLTFSKGLPGERHSVQLNDITEEIKKILIETFPKNITLRFSLAPYLRFVEADPTQLHQVILNLCINARDAMPDGGVLHLSTAGIVIDETLALETPDARAGEYNVCMVSDTGLGIAPEIIPRIFDPFFTTKGVGEGTGLGLSTCIGIIRGLGGFITVKTQVGQGTTFKVFLPVSTNSGAVEATQGKTASPQGEGETILLVDDETSINTVTSYVLKNNGYTVLTAQDGAEALELYKKNEGKIAVVLTDILMPEMDGVMLTRKLKALNSRLKIIASSGHAAEAQVSELDSLGVDVILRKPYDSHELLTALHDVLGK